MREKENAEHNHTSSRCPCRPAQRRPHKKSRNGCHNCKRRRIKCDEKKPICTNCSHVSLPCSFGTADNVGTTIILPNAPRKRGRPLKWAPILDTATTSVPEQSELVPGDHGHSLPGTSTLSNLPLNVNDLQLYHHYITDTSLTLGDDVLWCKKVPNLAFENPFILELMLGFAALHLARLQTTEATKYEQLAEQHHSKALRDVTTLLPQISQKNCSALYIATVLVCNYAFAKPHKRGHLLLVAEGTEVPWWKLFRGVRFVIETMGQSAIFSGHIGPFPPENTTKLPSTEGKDGYIPWERPLASLSQTLLESQEPTCKSLAAICEGLVSCFNDVFGTAEQPQDVTHGKMHVVMRWLWFLEDDFIKQIEQHRSEALVLLAHFSVLVQTVECFWFMKGWAHRILHGVLEHLDPAYEACISWPLDQLGLSHGNGVRIVH